MCATIHQHLCWTNSKMYANKCLKIYITIILQQFVVEIDVICITLIRYWTLTLIIRAQKVRVKSQKVMKKVSHPLSFSPFQVYQCEVGLHFVCTFEFTPQMLRVYSYEESAEKKPPDDSCTMCVQYALFTSGNSSSIGLILGAYVLQCGTFGAPLHLK